jgi:hyperosmotically inducible periplasmic protein
MKRTLQATMMMFALAALVLAAPTKPLSEQVRHELAMLPYYNVFDDLKFQIDDDGAVTLLGAVTRPVLRSDAETAVKRVAGVTRVTNEIEVLPLSRMDDHIRLAAYRAVYSSPGLTRLSFQAQPPVHIIVKNGAITLEGIAPNKLDRQVAYMRVMSVPGAFQVTNNLAVEGVQ